MKKKMITICILAAAFLAQAQTRELLFDFGVPGMETAGNWNNVTENRIGVLIADAIDSSGKPSGVSLAIAKTFEPKFSPEKQGVAAEDLYPVTAQQDYFTANAANPGEIRLAGLPPGKLCTVTFFGSRAKPDNLRNGEYSIGSMTATLNAAQNTKEVAVIRAAAADADGQLIISVKNASDSKYGYLGVLQVTWTP